MTRPETIERLRTGLARLEGRLTGLRVFEGGAHHRAAMAAEERRQMLTLRRQVEARLDALDPRATGGHRDALMLAWWDSLRPGDTWLPPGRPLRIRRKAPGCLTLHGGARWTVEDLTGLPPGRIAELRAARHPGPEGPAAA